VRCVDCTAAKPISCYGREARFPTFDHISGTAIPLAPIDRASGQSLRTTLNAFIVVKVTAALREEGTNAHAKALLKFGTEAVAH